MVSLLSLWLPSLNAYADLIKNCYQRAKENIPTVQLDNGFAFSWFPFIYQSIQETLKTEFPEPDTVPVINLVSSKYLNEKHSVYHIQGIVFGMGRVSERQGKEDLRVSPAFRELITEAEYRVINLAYGANQEERNEGIPSGSSEESTVETILLPGAVWSSLVCSLPDVPTQTCKA